MAAPQTISNNIVVGAGYVYFDEEDANGVLTGERYIGDTPGFTLNMTSEKIEVDSSDGPVAETLVSLVKKVTRLGNVTLRNIDMDNLATFVMGDTATVTQTATPVADEALTVKQGRYYQLGASTTNPTGVRNVSSVTVDDATGAGTAYTVTDDYIVDAAMGRIYIVPGGGIADDATIYVDYTPAANSRTRIATNDLGAKRGAIRFMADNTNGTNRDVYIPLCEFGPSGDAAFKDRDNPMELAFELNVLTRTGYEQVYIDGVAA